MIHVRYLWHDLEDHTEQAATQHLSHFVINILPVHAPKGRHQFVVVTKNADHQGTRVVHASGAVGAVAWV